MPVCHTPLQDPKFFRLLELIDVEHAAQVRAGGCSCEGVLHSARYRRKPRGGAREFQRQEHWRLSFCCNCCRQRHTPRSVVYLGRRVFLAAVVVLGSTQRSRLTARAVQSQPDGLLYIGTRDGDPVMIPVTDRRT